MPEPTKKCPAAERPTNGRRSQDKPWFPFITCIDGFKVPVSWGWGGRVFLLALCVSLSGAGLMAYRVDATEEKDEIIEKNIHVMDRNMHKIDENQRINASQTGLMVKQLNALLELNGVTERIDAPAVKPSELEPIE
jgi:hypothetical protein